MAAHKGLINTSFYFGMCQECESSVVLGHGGAVFVYIELCRTCEDAAASTEACLSAHKCGAVTLPAQNT